MSQSKSKESSPKPRKSEEFKQEAIALAKQVGAAQAAKDLGVYQSQIYQWKAKAAAFNKAVCEQFNIQQ